MVVLTPHFTSLLAFVASSSMIMAGVDALPYRPATGGVGKPQSSSGRSNQDLLLPPFSSRRDLKALDPDWKHDAEGDSHKVKRRHRKRPHRHSGNRHHHWHHDGTKVYADNPIIVSGDNNHVHAHSHKKRSEESVVLRRTPCGELGGWYSGRPSSVDRASPHRLASLLIDPTWQELRGLEPGTANFMRAYRRQRGKRGLADSWVPLLAPIPGIAGVIDVVGTVAQAVLNEKLASLIIAPEPSVMGAQSVDDKQLSGYAINASNSTSTTMYLVPQDTPANLGQSEKVVLITMPVVQSKDQELRLYCASYDPNSASPSQLSSQPCVYNVNAGLDINSTSTHFSQLFSWNIEDGTISPLWLNQAEPALVDTTSAPGGAPDPADMSGYVIGGAPSLSAANAGQPLSRNFGMIFRASPPTSSQPGNPTELAPSSTTSPTTLGSPKSSTDEQAATYPDEEDRMDDPDDSSQASQAIDGSYDNEDANLENHKNSPDGTQTDEDEVIEESTALGSDLAPSTILDQGATPTTASPAQENTQAVVVTSTFTMLVAPTQSIDA